VIQADRNRRRRPPHAAEQKDRRQTK